MPAAIATAISFNGGSDRKVYTALCLYAIAGFLWAWRQFARAQEAGWTGGVVTFFHQRSVEAGKRSSSRTQRPFTALIVKELQLHQIGLAGMGGLFVLHLGVVGLRKAGHSMFGELVQAGLESFGLLWVVVPFLMGSQSVAEERKLGTMDGLMSLPDTQ